MESKTTIVEVTVKDIDIDDRFFTFKYDMILNGKGLFKDEEYHSDHSWGNDKESFKELLLDDYGAQLVLEEIGFKK